MIGLRPATEADAAEIAALFAVSRRLLTFLPDLHTVEEDRCSSGITCSRTTG